MDNLTHITLHGSLGESVGTTWKLAVESVGEAMRAIQCNSYGRFYRHLLEKDKEGIKYQLLINKRPYISAEPLSKENIHNIVNSELVMKNNNLRSIDIVPVIVGADEGTLGVIFGIVLIIVGAILTFTGAGSPLGVPIMMAGLGLLAAGVSVLLSSPPKFEDFREIDGSTGKTSYLFNGPQNTTNECWPVPVGYGQLLCGSQVVSASYVISDYTIGSVDTVAPPYVGGGGGGVGDTPRRNLEF